MDQEQTEQLEGIGIRILSAARDELYLGMRFLDVALSNFAYQMDGNVDGFGTDGQTICFDPRALGGLYREDRILVNRAYLHMVFHCIFRHFAWEGPVGPTFSAPADPAISNLRNPTPSDSANPTPSDSASPAASESVCQSRYDTAVQPRESDAKIEDSVKLAKLSERCRDLSCDIAVEHLIDGLNYRSIRYSRSPLRRETYRLLEKEKKTLNAQRIYKILASWNLPEKELVRLEQEFRVDDHRYWESKQPDKKPNPQLSRRWGDIGEGIETDLETFSQEAGKRDGDFLDQIRVENRSAVSYRDFLRRFAVFHEELAVDDDSFDYNFYAYGLRLYKNLPLIEPLETREVKKVEEFAVVIDTSLSCSGDLVRRFLTQTYAALTEEESFFKKVNIHILQCDEKVHTDQKITSREELKAYMENLSLYGEGGTDFRPAFAWVDRLIETREFTNLKGLIYFTDGYGVYPAKMPTYRTAFVFLSDNYTAAEVPPWAIKLVLDEDDI